MLVRHIKNLLESSVEIDRWSGHVLDLVVNRMDSSLTIALFGTPHESIPSASITMNTEEMQQLKSLLNSLPELADSILHVGIIHQSYPPKFVS